MLASPLPPPILVQQPQDLHQHAARLAGEARLAVDTEANSLHAYREQVCLIQFSSPQDDYLIDPLALEDLSVLGPIFSAPCIEKIFHAAEYDVLGLHRDFGYTFSNVFDTMIAARTLGYPSTGLGSLLKEKFAIDLDKHSQKADWGHRPLSERLVDYARLDTHYLFDLRDCLEAELRARERYELAAEDFRRVAHPNGGTEKKTRPQWERLGRAQKLTPRQLTILSELFLSRERLAERLNRPVFKVVSDERLIAIAQQAPQNLDGLAEAGLTPHQVARFGQPLLHAVQRGAAADLVKSSRIVRPSDAVLSRLDKLKRWRKKVAGEMLVESDVILPRVYLQALAEKGPRDIPELETLLAESPWRLANFGSDILKALSSKK